MTGFSADWLARREPSDRRARNGAVIAAVAAAFAGREAIVIVDLACGTGSTMRALSPHLPARQSWLLVDNDAGLLARARASASRRRLTARTAAIDIAGGLRHALDAPADLVTASALLDLVSAEWLERLASETQARGLPVYATLTYDGRAALEPADPLDAALVAAVNRHQRADKGFGAALGPAAAGAAIALFQSAGWRVAHGPADWRLGASQGRLQGDLIEGWASAAIETGALAAEDVAAWLVRRRRLIAGGRSSIRVGHTDFFARPRSVRRAAKLQSNSTSSPSP
jgi:hypothetical protein